MYRISRDDTAVLLGLVVIFAIIAGVGASGAALEWDEGSFLLNAEYFLGADENYEQSRPATISYMIAGIWAVTGENTFAARLLIVLFGIACIAIFYRIAAQETERPLLPTAAFAFTPLLLYWSFHVYTDVPGLFFVLLGWYWYRAGKHVLAGVSLAVAATVRYLFLLFAAGMAVAYLINVFQDDELQDFFRYVGGGLLGSMPFFTYSALQSGGLFARIRMYVTRVTKWSDSGMFATTAASLESAVWMLSGLIPAAVYGWRQASLVEKTMIIVYAGFMILFSGNSFTRYWLPLVPILLLMTYRAVDTRWFVLAVAVMVAVSGWHIGTAYQSQQLCEEPFIDALESVKGQEGAVVSDQWAVAGYILDREVTSPWAAYDTLHADHNVQYAVTTDDLPYHRLGTFSNDCWTYYVYDLSQPQ